MKAKICLILIALCLSSQFSFGQTRFQRLKIPAASFKLTSAQPFKLLKSFCHDAGFEAPNELMELTYDFLSSPSENLILKVDGKDKTFDEAVNDGIIRMEVDSKDEVTFHLIPDKAKEVHFEMKQDMVISPYAKDTEGVVVSKSTVPENSEQRNQLQHEHWINTSTEHRERLVEVLDEYGHTHLAGKISEHDYTKSNLSLVKSEVASIIEDLEKFREAKREQKWKALMNSLEKFMDDLKTVPLSDREYSRKMPLESSKVSHRGKQYPLIDFMKAVGLDEKHFAKCMLKASLSETIGDFVDNLGKQCFYITKKVTENWSADEYLVLELETTFESTDSILIIIPKESEAETLLDSEFDVDSLGFYVVDENSHGILDSESACPDGQKPILCGTHGKWVCRPVGSFCCSDRICPPGTTCHSNGSLFFCKPK